MLYARFTPNGFRTMKLGRCALLWALLLATSCGAGGSPTSDETPSVYVGSVEETDAKIALVRDGARWAAYLCGGAETLGSTAWFKGERGTGKRADVIAAAGDHDLDATITTEDASGSVTVNGKVARFEAARVTQTGAVGLFYDDSNGCRSGLIVPEAGEPQGAYCVDVKVEGRLAERSFEQVNPLMPLTLRDGFLVASAVNSADVVLRLKPVLLPLNSL